MRLSDPYVVQAQGSAHRCMQAWLGLARAVSTVCTLGQACVGEWLSDGKNLKHRELNSTVKWELAQVDGREVRQE